MPDAVQRGRRKNPRVQEAVSRIRGGETLRQIAADWKVTHQRVSQIVRSAGYDVRDLRPWKPLHFYSRGKWLALFEQFETLVGIARELKIRPNEIVEALTRLNSSVKEMRKLAFPAKFWKKVDRKGHADCWPWRGATTSQGYGRICVREFFGSVDWEYAHRVAFWLTKGSYAKSLWILHHCDNPPCCNPKHIYVGTAKDNARDREERGRSRHRKKAKKTP